MASFGKTLKKLFSSNVIVRKSASGEGIKVVDSSKAQAYNQDYFRDRFNRVYQSSLIGSQHDMNGSHGVLRNKLYNDYDMMDHDPILSSALDIYSDETTTRSEDGDILNIKTNDDQIKEILHNLFYDILNVEFNLWPWTRNLCKYGDFFLLLHISEKYGIINVSPLPPRNINRIENSDPENPHYVKFSDEAGGNKEYENFEIAHFRLLGDQNFIPYGKSMMENGRRIFKQLQLMEDAMLIHRIMRAPSKRVFKIDIGNIPPAEVDNYMEQTINKMKKEPHVDKRTGEYNLRYNIQNMTEDFYLPVRGQNSNTDISELRGLEYDGVKDIEYLKSKLLASLKIPKAYLGYDETLSGKSTLAQEDIRFARTIERIQRIVESELTKIAIVHLFAQGYRDNDLINFSVSLNNPSTLYQREQINILQSKLSVVRDIRSENIFSEDWIYENMFDMTEDEIKEERERLFDDMKRRHRFEEMERQGNDPWTDDEMDGDNNNDDDDSSDDFDFMTDSDKDPSDDYDQGDFDKNDFYAFGKRGGRPKDTDRYEKDDHHLGRDPVGMKGRSAESVLNKLGLNKTKFSSDNNQLDLLSEDNIMEND